MFEKSHWRDQRSLSTQRQNSHSENFPKHAMIASDVTGYASMQCRNLRRDECLTAANDTGSVLRIVCMDFDHDHASSSACRPLDIPRECRPCSHLRCFAGLLLVVAFPFPAVNAEDPLSFHVPPNVTLCEPVDLVWTGGSPPYRLDIEPLVNNTQQVNQNVREINIAAPSYTWTPIFLQGQA